MNSQDLVCMMVEGTAAAAATRTAFRIRGPSDRKDGADSAELHLSQARMRASPARATACPPRELGPLPVLRR